MEGRVRWLALPLVAMHPAVARRERGFGVDEDIEESRTISRTISATRRAECIGLLLGQMRGEGGATVTGKPQEEMKGMMGKPGNSRAFTGRGPSNGLS